jgi:chitodextrinase
MSTFRKASLLPLILASVTGPSTAWAARDRIAPTAPTALRVTGTTSYSVSLAWNPSTDNSGVFTYVICCAGTSSESVGQKATSHTYRAGLEPSRTFTLRIYARDAAGNTSKASNAVTFTLPVDTSPPTKPLVSVTGVGPTYVSLAWSSVEDGPHVWFTVFKDGSPIIQGSESTSAIIPLLQTETTYAFTVQAQDFAGNRSPLSDASAVTTEAGDPDDVTPPTTPGNFSASTFGCEVGLSWSESTDDLDPQWVIEYQVFVNDVYDHSLSLRTTRTVVYGTVDGANTFSVVAVDSAGNRSAPATLTADLDCVP